MSEAPRDTPLLTQRASLLRSRGSKPWGSSGAKEEQRAVEGAINGLHPETRCGGLPDHTTSSGGDMYLFRAIQSLLLDPFVKVEELVKRSQPYVPSASCVASSLSSADFRIDWRMYVDG